MEFDFHMFCPWPKIISARNFDHACVVLKCLAPYQYAVHDDVNSLFAHFSEESNGGDCGPKGVGEASIFHFGSAEHYLCLYYFFHAMGQLA